MANREENLGVDLRHNRGCFEATPSGDIAEIKGLDNLNQRLFHRLITVRGTLVHRPEFGIGIQNFKGQITTIDKQRDLALQIRDQFLMDSDVETVEQVQFNTDDLQPDLFTIFVKYTAVGYNEVGANFDPFELGA